MRWRENSTNTGKHSVFQMKGRTMKIQFNGKPCETENEITLDRLLEIQKPQGKFAVALNLKFVPRSEYPRHTLKENDSVEVLSPQVGG